MRGQTVSANLDDALSIVDRIARIRSLQRELRSAFARSELDGGAKEAAAHPLYLEAERELTCLHDQLMILI